MRSEIAGRPLLAASLSLILGISAVAHPAHFALFPLLLWLSYPKSSRLIAVSCAFLVGLLIAPGPATFDPADKGAWKGIGTVSTAPTLGARSESCIVDTDDGAYQLIAASHSDLALGQTVSLSGRVPAPAGTDQDRLRQQNLVGTLLCAKDGVSILKRGPFWFEAANTLRNSFIGSVDAVIPGAQGALVNALCFAATGPVQPGLRRDLSRTGSVHILSASGLQVFLLAFLVQAFLSLFPIRRGVQVGAVVLVLAIYASATGLHPATIRAVVMAAVALSAYLFRREADFLSALGLAAILTVLWEPWSIYTPGFQLSYVTVAALAMYWRRFDEKTGSKVRDRILSRIWFVLRASLIATLASAPLTAYHFGQLPIASPITNLLIAPAVPIIIAVSLVAWPLGFALPALQVGLLKVVVSPLASWVMVVTGLFGRQAWCSIAVPQFSAYWLALYYAAFLALWNRRVK